MGLNWKEQMNMENFDIGESIQTTWYSLLSDALQRKHYLATKALLRLCRIIYEGNNNTSISSSPSNRNNVGKNNKDGINKQNSNNNSNNNNNRCRNNNTFEMGCDSTQTSTRNVCSVKDDKCSYFTVLAVQTNNLKFMRLLLTHQFEIRWPHGLDCRCWLCESDKLGQSKRRIESLHALSSPLWISLTSDDPFLTSFKIMKQCKLYRSHQDCYEKEYAVILKQNVNFCTGLLDQIQNEDEVNCLMKWKNQRFIPFKNISNLAFIRLGIKYGVKEVVAHAVPQHVIMSIVSDGIPRWKSSGIVYRMSFILLVAFCYPFTALVRVCAPRSYIGRMAARPLIKFVNGVASFITLLTLLAFMATYPKTGLRIGDNPSPIEVLILIWIFSLFYQELKQLTNTGKKYYFGSGWNWIDINMICLMLVSYAMWIVMYFVNPLHQDERYKFFISFPDGFFALAIILSFFRMVCLCQITRFLGLLQLCLGRMLQVLFQFAFISIVILCSFSVGLVFLFHSSNKFNQIDLEMSLKNQNRSYVDQMLSRRYNGLPATLVTLSWASMNMVGLESLDGLDDGTMVHLWSYVLFTLYHFISMIVLLNMLIAMMSNSYQQIENNIDIEHKYARTNLWLEYLGDNNMVPCPFNLLPTVDILRKYLHKIEMVIKKESVERKCREESAVSQQQQQYKILCKHLVQRYIRKVYNMSLDDEVIINRHVTDDVDEDPFLAMVKEKVKIWSRELNQENNVCDNLAYRNPSMENSQNGCTTDIDGMS